MDSDDEDLGQSENLLQFHALKRQQQMETTRGISAHEALKHNTEFVADTNVLLRFPEISIPSPTIHGVCLFLIQVIPPIRFLTWESSSKEIIF